MNRVKAACLLFICWMLVSCGASRKTNSSTSVNIHELKSTVVIKKKQPFRTINVKAVTPADLVAFAQTLLGVPYRYGSLKKENGFDCSGFINYVFNYFKISVPRSSVEFTNAGREVKPADSKPGDLILFTGSNHDSGEVGHMGIVTENRKNQFTFIHASSSKGVILSGLSPYFTLRLVKVIRIFP